jgi:WD40 repeat protein
MEKLKEEKVIKIDFVPNRIACLSDGRIVVAFGDRDKFGIKIFKLNENKELNLEKELSEHTKYISSLFILEDGKIVTTSLDGTAVFYNPFEMKIVCKIQEKKKKNFTSVAQFEDRSVIMSSPKGVIYVLQ